MFEIPVSHMGYSGLETWLCLVSMCLGHGVYGGFLLVGALNRLQAQMHLYIEPLNGSIDVTSFFRRMQYTTQKIAFLF